MTSPLSMRSAVQSVPAYRPGKQPAQVAGLTPFKLSSNENHLPPLPAVLETIADASLTPNAYPDPTARVLVEALADYLDVPTDHIAVGAGASELLAAAVRLTTDAGSEVVYPWPSFEMYPLLVSLADGAKQAVPLTAEARHDLAAMAAAINDNTRLVLLCSPNNPTGPSLGTEEFDAFMAQVPAHVIVLLDEAYWEFSAGAVDGRAALDRYPNLLLVRTFSKAHGLAGLRVGYAVGAPELITELKKALAPFGVTAAAQAAAVASLQHHEDIMLRAKTVAAARDQLAAKLRELGWQVPDSQANFVFLKLGADATAEAFEDACLARSLAVRKLGTGVRISVGPDESMERVVEVARDFRAAQGGAATGAQGGAAADAKNAGTGQAQA